MDMLGLKSKLKDEPALLSTFLFYELLAPLFDLADKNGLAAARAPDQMIDDEMNAMFISLIVV
jgi:hypothetical protein